MNPGTSKGLDPLNIWTQKDSITCNIIARMLIEAINHISLHNDSGLGIME